MNKKYYRHFLINLRCLTVCSLLSGVVYVIFVIWTMYHEVASLTEPQFNKDQPVFTHINSSHARLNLQGWASGGCPISAVTLEFRPKGGLLFSSFH